MMIYTTLKANKQNGIDFLDIATYYEECYGDVADLFGDEYTTEYGTDLDKLCEDYTARQIASAVLKEFKKYAKDDDDKMFIWNKIFFDGDLPELVYDKVEGFVKEGKMRASDLRDFNQIAKKNGVEVKKEICTDEVNHYYGWVFISDIIDEYFPCYAKIYGEGCCNCCNCD